MTNRILTTHTGSLPRTAKVVELLLAEEQKPGARRAELQAAVREAVRAGRAKSRSNAASTSSMTANRAALTTPCMCSSG